ncbi:MAG: hypothetical protein QM640_14405 [Niabella sp.]
MKKNVLLLCSVLAVIAISCKNKEDEKQDMSTDIGAAIGFLQAALKGKYDVAADYMLHDSTNDEQLDAVSRVRLSSEEKIGLWGASINIHSRKLINDSTSIIVYSNSFHKENSDTLKVVKKEGRWLVDFKYLFDHD